MSIPKEKVAVIGTGPAGLAAAFALHNDREKKFDVHVFEMGPYISLDGHTYEYVEPQSGRRSRIDVPMRVFSGRYYQNLFNLLKYLEIPSVERRFLFAFADQLASVSKYYFLHPSNNHRAPIVCRQTSGISGLFSALWTSFTVACCYIWFSIACFWISPRVGGKSNETETIGAYLARVRLPKFFVDSYVIPLFSSVASSPHEVFLDFPAVYLTDYKRQTHMFPHNTADNMAVLQSRLIEGIHCFYNARVIKVERCDKGVKLHYENTKSGDATDMMFDRIVLAVSPKQTAAIHPPTAYAMDRLQTCDVSVVIHQDYSILPEDSRKLVHDPRSELMALQVKYDSAVGKSTVATHAHPCGILITVWPGNLNLVDIDPKKVLHVSKFARLLASPVSRDALSTMFHGDSSSWRNGDGGVYVCGGWTWDGFALLEGCVWSGVSTARTIGAELPHKLSVVEREWHL